MGPGAELGFGVLFLALTGYNEWIARTSPRRLPWRKDGAERVLRIERLLIRVPTVITGLIGLSLGISGFANL